MGETRQLTAYASPRVTVIEWGSSNEDVATVSDDGLVTAVSVGSAVISATSGETIGTCDVTVEYPYALSISGDAVKDGVITLSAGESAAFDIDLSPAPPGTDVLEGATLLTDASTDDFFLSVSGVEDAGKLGVTASCATAGSGTVSVSLTSGGNVVASGTFAYEVAAPPAEIRLGSPYINQDGDLVLMQYGDSPVYVEASIDGVSSGVEYEWETTGSINAGNASGNRVALYTSTLAPGNKGTITVTASGAATGTKTISYRYVEQVSVTPYKDTAPDYLVGDTAYLYAEYAGTLTVSDATFRWRTYNGDGGEGASVAYTSGRDHSCAQIKCEVANGSVYVFAEAYSGGQLIGVGHVVVEVAESYLVDVEFQAAKSGGPIVDVSSGTLPMSFGSEYVVQAKPSGLSVSSVASTWVDMDGMLSVTGTDAAGAQGQSRTLSLTGIPTIEGGLLKVVLSSQGEKFARGYLRYGRAI